MSAPLCRLADIPPDGCVALEGGLFAVRTGDAVAVYVNACPHLGAPLDWLPGRFLSTDEQRIVCALHGAEFRREDGHCLRGPCRGDRLTAVPFTLQDGLLRKRESAESLL